MSEVQTVDESTVTDDGNPLTGVVVSKPSVSRWLKPMTLALIIATVFCVIFSLTVTLAFIAPSIDRLTRSEVAAREERETLIGQVAQLESDARGDRILAACLALYNDDIRASTGRSQLALSDLFVAAVNGDPTRSAEQRRIDNDVLVKKLDKENEPLRHALEAYEAYTRNDPPPRTCPHPNYRSLESP